MSLVSSVSFGLVTVVICLCILFFCCYSIRRIWKEDHEAQEREFNDFIISISKGNPKPEPNKGEMKEQVNIANESQHRKWSQVDIIPDIKDKQQFVVYYHHKTSPIHI